MDLLSKVSESSLKEKLPEFNVGDTIKVAFDLTKLHIFDKETTLTITE